MAADHDEDLAALLARITRRLADAERPVLAEHGLSMWAYVVLSHLAHAPAGTQLALAQAIHYDKTRLIALLDGLEADGLITRDPDPADRRARVVALTATGAARHAAAQRAIRAMEDALLMDLPAADRTRLRRTLARVDAATRSARDRGPTDG
jgi:DNA-binding MarR family transcriptional regulator